MTSKEHRENEERPDDVFAETDTMEEALTLRKVIMKYVPWPLIYTDGAESKFQVGGLTKFGGKLPKETVALVKEELKEYLHEATYKDLDGRKFKNTIEELKRN